MKHLFLWLLVSHLIYHLKPGCQTLELHSALLATEYWHFYCEHNFYCICDVYVIIIIILFNSYWQRIATFVSFLWGYRSIRHKVDRLTQFQYKFLREAITANNDEDSGNILVYISIKLYSFSAKEVCLKTKYDENYVFQYLNVHLSLCDIFKWKIMDTFC